MKVWTLHFREAWEETFYVKAIYDSEEKAKDARGKLLESGTHPADADINEYEVE